MRSMKFAVLILIVLSIGAGFFSSKLLAQTPPPVPPANETPEACVARNLSEFMNEVVAGTRGLQNIRLLSPAFNLTNPAEVEIHRIMRNPSGAFPAADFSSLWGYAGNTYTVSGTRAMDYYNLNGWESAFSGKPVVFTEFGDFSTADIREGDPARSTLISSMTQDYNQALSRSNITGINYFAAYDDDDINVNPEFYEPRHRLTREELLTITAGGRSRAGLNQGLTLQGGALQVKATELGMGWTVEIIEGPDLGVANSVNASSANTVIRLCVGDNCGFGGDGGAARLVDFLTELNGLVSRPVYIIAGPNEPATENWAAPECADIAAPEPPRQPYDVEPIIPCNATTDPQYHSLRPYPANPCDPEPVVTPALCADDPVARVQYTFQNCNPGAGGTCTYNVTSSVDLTLGIQTAELPIVGNTEDVPNSESGTSTIDFRTRMNEYASWYLNGVTSRAEEEDELTIQTGRIPALTQGQINERINEVINLSGPIKKLLPYALQFNEINTILGVPDPVNRFAVEGFREQQKQDVEAGTIRHNQIVVCTAGSILSQWPTACYRTDTEIRRYMVGDPMLDARYLDAHARLFSFIPFSSTEDRVGTISADSRGAYTIEGGAGTEDGGAGVDPNSIDFIPNPNLPSADGLNIPYRRLYFAHMQEVDELGDILQRMFVPQEFDETERAPQVDQPGITAQEASPFCEPLEEPISNPGDNLYAALQRDGGEPVQGTLTFNASFTCEFPPPLPNQQCIDNCMFNNPTAPPDPYTYCATTQCPPVVVNECTRTVLIPMQARVTTPLADNLWSRLVYGPMSVFRRMFPHVNEEAPVSEILDIPGETDISYSAGLSPTGVNTGPYTNTTVDAIAGNPYEGNSAQGSLYFPHLGSIHQYFLRGIQCALRPYGACPLEEVPDEDGTLVCSIDNSGIQSQELMNIITDAARWANVPVEALVTIVRGEGCGGGDPRVDPAGARTGGICQYTDEQVLLYSAPGAFDPRNCPSSGSKGPLQMYEDSVGWTPWRDAVNMATGQNRTPNICNLMDAIYAGAYRLSAGYDGCPNSGHNVSSVPAPQSWTPEQIDSTLTSWARGCAPTGTTQQEWNCSGVAADFYCSAYDIWSANMSTTCTEIEGSPDTGNGGGSGSGVEPQPAPPLTGSCTGNYDRILDWSFNNSHIGQNPQNVLRSVFGAPNSGNFSQVSFVQGPGTSEAAMRVHFNQGSYHNRNGGIITNFSLPGSQAACLQYQAYFDPGFDFGKGGKLPGLGGGWSEGVYATGCRDGTEQRGFSTRYMWRAAGEARVYMYYPFKTQECGDNARTTYVQFPRGRWFTLEQEVVLNTVSNGSYQRDGIIRAWLDGTNFMNRTQLFRIIPQVDIDVLFMHNYFGGDATYASSRSQNVYFRDFRLYY